MAGKRGRPPKAKTNAKNKPKRNLGKEPNTVVIYNDELEVFEKMTCISHGGRPLTTGLGSTTTKPSFYKASQGSIFASMRVIPICKTCINNMYVEYYRQDKNAMLAVWKVCRRLDIAFVHNIYEGAVTRARNTIQEKVKNGTFEKGECEEDLYLGWYLQQYNSFYLTTINPNGNFDLSEPLFGEDEGEEPTKKDIALIKEREELEKFSEEDYRNKEDVIKILGEDPFAGRPRSLQKILYASMMGYLSGADAEDISEDTYRVSVLKEIVEASAQLEVYNRLIGNIIGSSDGGTGKEINMKNLLLAKKDIISMISQLAKDNGIAVSARKDNSQAKGTLGDLMKKLRNMGFQDAEVDFYDQKTSNAMKHVADISNKSIIEQLKLGEYEMQQVIEIARERTQELEKERDRLEEELRVAKVELYKLKDD